MNRRGCFAFVSNIFAGLLFDEGNIKTGNMGIHNCFVDENKIDVRLFGKSSDFSCILLLILLRNSFFFTCLRVFLASLI
jgi:hypothetical protein